MSRPRPRSSRALRCPPPPHQRRSGSPRVKAARASQHRSEPGLVGMGGDEPGCSGVRDRELSRYRHGQHGYGRYERCGFDAASARRVCAAGGDAQANSRGGCLSDGTLRNHRGGTDPDRRSGALPQPEAGVRSAAARCQDETRASRLEERLEDGAASVAEAKADQGESRADRPGFHRQPNHETVDHQAEGLTTPVLQCAPEGA